MKCTTEKALNLNKAIDLLDANGKFTRTVTTKFTENKFAFAKVMNDHEAYQKLVEEEFYKHIGRDKKELQNLPEDEQIEIGEAFEKFIKEHTGYNDFLSKEVNINVTPIYKDDLKNCDYKVNLLFLLEGTIFFEHKPKVKASAK